MPHITEMLQTHPKASTVDLQSMRECIDACYDCAQSCNSCADACLAESGVQELVRCIRLNIDCAEICATTGNIMARLTERTPGIIGKMMEACVEACRACAQECERHAGMHEHCRVCAEARHRCEQACQTMLQSMSIGRSA